VASQPGSEGPRSRIDLLDAVGALGDEGSTGALGAREIGRRAKVNHSLVFRHFGSVEHLVAEALSLRLAVVAAEMSRCDDLAGALGLLLDALGASRRLLVTIIEAGGSSGLTTAVIDLLGPQMTRLITGDYGVSPREAPESVAIMTRAAIGLAVVVTPEADGAIRESEIQALLAIASLVEATSDVPHDSDGAVLRSPTQHNSGAQGKPV
jgi:AcrR family transcriptional regulator